MKNKITVIAGLIIAVLIIAIGVNYDTSKYSREDIGVEQNEEITMLFLPDNTTIITNDKTGIGMIYQPAGVTISFTNNSIDAALRDSWAIESESGEWTLLPRLQENLEILEKYSRNNTKIIENGTALLLPDETIINLMPENKGIIKLKSKIIIVKDDNDDSLAIQFYDGWIYRSKNGNWIKLSNEP